MNELKVFNNSEFGELGVMLIDGKNYFPAKYCASVLGYKDTTNAIKQHCKGVVKHHLPTNGGTQMVNYIPEGDLYRLIVSSKLPSAQKFEHWVFDEVLPSIRKTGGYIPNVEEIIARTAAAVVSEIMKHNVLSSVSTKPKRKRRKGVYSFQNSGKVETLPKELKEQVDNMIVSNKFSCQAIANFLLANGVQISQMTINKYAHRYFWDEEASFQLTFQGVFHDGK